MAAFDLHAVEPQPGQYVSAKSFSESQSLSPGDDNWDSNRAIRQALKDLIDQPKALLDFADADPDARINIACRKYWNRKVELIVGSIAGRLAGIDIPAAGAPDIAAAPNCRANPAVTIPVVTVRSCSEAVLS